MNSTVNEMATVSAETYLQPDYDCNRRQRGVQVGAAFLERLPTLLFQYTIMDFAPNGVWNPSQIRLLPDRFELIAGMQ